MKGTDCAGVNQIKARATTATNAPKTNAFALASLSFSLEDDIAQCASSRTARRRANEPCFRIVGRS